MTCGKSGGRTLKGNPCNRSGNGENGRCHSHTNNNRFTDEQIRQVEKLAAVFKQEDLADFFRMGHDTFNARKREDERLDSAYKKGRTDAVAAVATSLLQTALHEDDVKNRLRAQMFYLKCQAGWRETDRLEHVGAGGGPIQTEDVTRIREELKTKLTLIQGGKAS